MFNYKLFYILIFSFIKKIPDNNIVYKNCLFSTILLLIYYQLCNKTYKYRIIYINWFLYIKKIGYKNSLKVSLILFMSIFNVRN